jgi:GNAT superfamily N-acetyltransferase
MTLDRLEETVAVWERTRWDAQQWLEERMGYSHEDNLRYFRDVISRESDVWIATIDEKVVGLLAMGKDQIEQLYVDTVHQGQGVGTALLEKAKTLAPTGFTLYTHQRNQKARAFYESRGLLAVAFGVSPEPESEPDVQYAWNTAQ